MQLLELYNQIRNTYLFLVTDVMLLCWNATNDDHQLKGMLNQCHRITQKLLAFFWNDTALSISNNQGTVIIPITEQWQTLRIFHAQKQPIQQPQTGFEAIRVGKMTNSLQCRP